MPYKDREKHKEQIKEARKIYNQKHSEEIKLKKKIYQAAHKEQIAQYRKINREKNNQYYTNRKQIFKNEALTYYGNGKLSCVRCGFDDIRALTIDHINGNGSEHRKSTDKNKIQGSHIYEWLVKNNYPKGYQTLCANCQFIKRTENNECQSKKETGGILLPPVL
jgi:serine/threonine protein phosphatase PrpC